jgi:hypothetical protein
METMGKGDKDTEKHDLTLFLDNQDWMPLVFYAI